MWKNWILPTQTNDSDTNVLTPEQIQSWREKGFALVNGLVSKQLVDAVTEEAMQTLLPLIDQCDFGSNGLLEYPTGMNACDEITLHPRILAAAAQLLDVRIEDLRMSQSDIWLKRGKKLVSGDLNDKALKNTNQRIHCGEFKLFNFPLECDRYFNLTFC